MGGLRGVPRLPATRCASGCGRSASARRARGDLVAHAAGAGPPALAALDAQARALATDGGRRGVRAAAAAKAPLAAAIEDPVGARERLPAHAWFARPIDPGPAAPPDAEPAVLLRGAVLVRARGRADEPARPRDAAGGPRAPR